MVCLVIGKVVEGNSVKSYVVMNENGSTQLVKRVSIFKFCRDNDVLNVTVSKNSLTGKGVMLSNIPKYKDTGIFGMQQVGGMSQEEVIQLAQPYIEQYRQNKQRKQSKQNSSNDKSKQEQYVMSKIDIIELLINCALQMKNITNEMASNGDFTRYIKQIDIDNAEGDSLDNLIKRQGVNGLAKGLLDRLNRLKNRVKKFGLHKNLLVMIEHLEKECEQLKKLHSETKQIIRQNKDKESIEEKENRQLESEAESENIDDIPVVEDAHIDAIEVNTSDKYIRNIDDIFGDIPVVEDANTDAIEIEYSESKSSEITSIDDIFKQEQPSKEDKETQNKIDELCDLYSKAVTNIGNIIHNTKRIAEIAHDVDMEYPGVHNRITKDKINSNYNSEDDIVKDISDHYDYIIAEENRGKLWQNLLTNYLGKVGNKVYKITFTGDAGIDDNNLNRHQELFDYYINTLMDKLVEQINIDKEQCIQKALQNFTKLSSSKREQMLEEVFGDSWYNAGNSLEEYGDEGWGGWTADDERKKAKRNTLAKYKDLSDEEFVEKITKEKEDKLLWKCRGILPKLYAVGLADGLNTELIEGQHEIVISTAVDKFIDTLGISVIQRGAFNEINNHPEDRPILLTEAVRCFNTYNGKYDNEAFGVGIIELDDLISKYREYNMNYCIELLSNVQTFIDNINTSMIVLKNGWLAKLKKEYYSESIVLLAKVYYVAKLCNFSDLDNKAYELEKLLNSKVFEIGRTMEK